MPVVNSQNLIVDYHLFNLIVDLYCHLFYPTLVVPHPNVDGYCLLRLPRYPLLCYRLLGLTTRVAIRWNDICRITLPAFTVRHLTPTLFTFHRLQFEPLRFCCSLIPVTFIYFTVDYGVYVTDIT